MAYLKPQEFKNKNYSYPKEDIDPQRKRTADHYLSVAKAMMSEYTNNYCLIPFEWGESRSISDLRKYATGRQSSDIIKQWIIGKKRKNIDGTYNTKMNVSFDTYAKLPQMFDIMRSRNMPEDYVAEFVCVDEDSLKAVENTRAMMKYLLDKNTKDFLSRAMFKPNFQPDPEALGIENEEEVDMHIDTGGFTLQWQIAAFALFEKSKMVSNYKEFQDMVFDDLIINPNGVTGAKTYIEKSTGIPRFRKVNMERAIIQYFDGMDSREKISRAGELRIMTISDIHRENPDISATQLYELARNFQWMNPKYVSMLSRDDWNNLTSNGYTTDVDIDPISRVKVLVLDFQFLSTDTNTFLKNEDTKTFKEVPFDYYATKRSKKDGDKVIKKKVIIKHEAKWIVGTDHFLNFGPVEDSVYYGEDGNKTPTLDYFFVKTGNMSLVERCVAIVNDMDMILVKHRNAWATLPAAPAMAIQKDLLENVFLNGELQQPEDIIQTLIERGVLYYNGLDDHGRPLYGSGGQKPIDYMDVSKMAQMLSLCSQELLVKVNELKEVLGLQGGVDGGNRNPYQGLGETQLAFEASNASLLPTYNAYKYLFRNIALDIVKKGQIQAKKKPYRIGYAVLGEKNMKMLELGGDFSAADFNCDVRIAASKAEREKIMADITAQRVLGSQTGGQQGLTTAEYLYVYDKVMIGNIKEAYFVMAKIEAKKRNSLRQQQLQDQQANIQSQQQSAMVKGQMDQANIQAKGQVQNENTVLSELLKQNTKLMDYLVAPKKEGESRTDPSIAVDQINTNSQDIAAILGQNQGQPTQEDQAIAAQQQGQMPLEPAM